MFLSREKNYDTNKGKIFGSKKNMTRLYCTEETRQKQTPTGLTYNNLYWLNMQSFQSYSTNCKWKVKVP